GRERAWGGRGPTAARAGSRYSAPSAAMAPAATTTVEPSTTRRLRVMTDLPLLIQYVLALGKDPGRPREEHHDHRPHRLQAQGGGQDLGKDLGQPLVRRAVVDERAQVGGYRETRQVTGCVRQQLPDEEEQEPGDHAPSQQHDPQREESGRPD